MGNVVASQSTNIHSGITVQSGVVARLQIKRVCHGWVYTLVIGVGCTHTCGGRAYVRPRLGSHLHSVIVDAWQTVCKKLHAKDPPPEDPKNRVYTRVGQPMIREAEDVSWHVSVTQYTIRSEPHSGREVCRCLHAMRDPNNIWVYTVAWRRVCVCVWWSWVLWPRLGWVYTPIVLQSMRGIKLYAKHCMQ